MIKTIVWIGVIISIGKIYRSNFQNKDACEHLTVKPGFKMCRVSGWTSPRDVG